MAAPIGVAGRPNRGGGSYERGSDGAAAGPPGGRRVYPTGAGGPIGTP